MTISDLLVKLAELLGIKDSEKRKNEKVLEKLKASKADNIDRLDEVKQQIKSLNRKLLKKKQEMDASTGDTKRIVTGEIERLFSELDRLQNRNTIIGRNIDEISLAIDRLAELEDGQSHGADENVFDEIAVNLDDVFADLKAADLAAEQLNKVQYEASKSESMDVQLRLKSLESESHPVENLSPENAERLKRLTEEDV